MDAWVTATAYTPPTLVTHSGSTYLCLVAHTSGTFATDLAADPPRWLLMSSVSFGDLQHSYTTLVNRLGLEMGLYPGVGPDVITDGTANSQQANDILLCIRDGLSWVYNAHQWSYLEPSISISTLAPYSTGTITIDANGVVTGTDTVFPDYSASSYGWLYVGLAGAFPIATYSSGTSITLSNYNQDAITTATTYSIWFHEYDLPAGVDSLKGPLVYPPSAWTGLKIELQKVTELQIEREMARFVEPSRPTQYCVDTVTFDATVGSRRRLRLWPPPDDIYTLSGVGTIRPTMIDATNLYPIGIEVMAAVLEESCLAAWERNIERKDAGHPDAVHSRALPALLQQAIALDKAKSSPETLGIASGYDEGRPTALGRIPIYLDIGGGIVGWYG